MIGTIAWIIAVIIGVIGLIIASIVNARALKRDMNLRRDAFRASLENQANAIVDGIFTVNKRESKSP
jgi:hypothetical protein